MSVALRYPGAEVAVVGQFDPNVLATTATSGRVKLGDFHSYMAVVNVGGVTSGTVDAKIVQYDAASGGNGKDLPGASITQLGATDDDVTAVIEFDGFQFDTDNGYFWFALSITANNAFVSGVLLGVYPRGDAAFADQGASVVERVTV